MSSLCIELSPGAEESLAQLSKEERRIFELKLTAQVALLLPRIVDRQQAVRGLQEIASRAEARAVADGLPQVFGEVRERCVSFLSTSFGPRPTLAAKGVKRKA